MDDLTLDQIVVRQSSVVKRHANGGADPGILPPATAGTMLIVRLVAVRGASLMTVKG